MANYIIPVNYVALGQKYGTTPDGPCEMVVGAVADGYSVDAVADGRLSPVCKFDGESGLTVGCSLNLVPNGDMEQVDSAGAPTGWNYNNATLTRDTTKTGGSYGMKLVAGGTDAHAWKEVAVRAGEVMTVYASLYGTGSQEAQLQVANMVTGNYLNSSGTWQAGATTVGVNSAASWVDESQEFTVETVAGVSVMKLVIRLVAAASTGTYYFDEVLLVPKWDFVGIFGADVGTADNISIVIDKQASYWHGGAQSELIDLTAEEFDMGNLYALESSSYSDPFPLVEFNNSVSYFGNELSVGEIFIGKSVTLPGLAYHPKVEFLEDQIRLASRGATYVHRDAARPRRRISMRFPLTSDADWQTLRDKLGLGSSWGAQPSVLILDDVETGMALYGRCAAQMMMSPGPNAFRLVDLVFDEAPHPVI